MAQPREPITCHVLNTLTGKPAGGMNVHLTLQTPGLLPPEPEQIDDLSFSGLTNQDGRVQTWHSNKRRPTPILIGPPTEETLAETMSRFPSAESTSTWSLQFDVGPWYEAQEVDTFFPEVEVKFNVQGRGEGDEGWRHYHVPLLLGPYSYTTYRGS